ncbi:MULTISPECIES: class I adenylate-forming enzyme family protein [unclassified Nocardioides]|uniref:class I adenylate-forming enzyme family protein n=1 Tax=unclassified Nocardioides TaxID=2615069 RepID=UPI000701A60F|nr:MULTISPECIES: class I adenylate-forming enzyme family protein [unclassified Nocardioides]KRA38571.1 AMP-binding protein [Nocardioides sp. Root614]KRA92531.1 AMP-binding protein [Nocardioides sp. Root682]
MIELVRRFAAADPARVAIITEDDQWSYGRLAAEADALAHGLRASGTDRFAIVSNDVPFIVALMAASSLVGAEACVYAPDITTEDLVRQAGTFGHEVVATTRTDLGDLPVTLRTPEDLRAEGPRIDQLPDSRPLLVLTTGTTGLPRGVRHDWSRQLSRTTAARDAAGQVWLLAYGPQQFAGLQVLIHVFSTGATLMAPPVRRPQAVMEALHTHGVDHISATPTFWRFLLAELRADDRPVPSLRQITLGGEAAPASLLEGLTETFPEARISHIYAGSEFGSTGSVRDGQGGLPAALLERGGDGDISLKIVDGELFVRSSASMLGYHGDTDLPEGEWWPTGDVVEVVGERIEFRGRKSDVINVGGVKVHPLPVEERVSSVPGVKVVRAYGRTNALVGAVVAIDVVPDGTVDERALKESIRSACADLPRPWQPRSIQVVEETAMKGNKIVRGTEER